MAIGSTFPGEINNYRQFGSDANIPDDDQIPISAKNRKVTDKFFIVAFLACILALIPLIWYTLYYSDVNRIIHGYDDCGNVCGQLNEKYPQWHCTGKDMRDKPVLQYGKCVSLIPDSNTKLTDLHRENKLAYVSVYDDDIANRALQREESTNERALMKEHTEENLLSYIQRVQWKLLTACLVSIVLCQCVVLLFRYATAMMVWTITIASWILLLLICIRLWMLVGSDYKGDRDGILVLAIFLSVVLLVLLCIMIFMRKSIKLVIMLLRESTKAIFDMPSTFVIPFTAIIGAAIVVGVWAVLTTYMSSSGILTELYNQKFKYVSNTAMIISLIWNLVIALWVLEFICGLQYMIISGAVARWYFARDKSLVGNPVRTSVYIAFRYHLGTIAFGSLILTLITMLRLILKSLAKNPRMRVVIDCCMGYLEGILRFFTWNAYIFTALHGTPFYTSGKKVTGLLKMNICNVVALNNIGDFVLRMSQVFLMIISYGLTAYCFLGNEKHDYNYYICTIIVVVITGITAFTILSTVETAVDSMFVCFCEDCTINDGLSKPYFMTTGLMQFVEKSKVVFAETIRKKGLPTI